MNILEIENRITLYIKNSRDNATSLVPREIARIIINELITNDGNKLTVEHLKERGFKKEVIKDNDGDEIKWWICDCGISIHEESWWIKELDRNDELLETPISCYNENETPPEIKFNFAVYIKGNGDFKGGMEIKTDKQLDNLIFALLSK
jgi:hypothetical protein